MFEFEFEMTDKMINNFIESVNDKTLKFTYEFGISPDCIYIDWLQYKKMEIWYRHSSAYKYMNQNSDMLIVSNLEMIPIQVDFDYLEVGFKDKNDMIGYKMYEKLNLSN